MALGTSAEIKAAAADWLNRTDLTSQIDDFFNMSVSEATRRLDLALGENVTEKAITSAEATAKKFFEPYGSLDVISITDEKGNRLEEVPFQQYRSYVETGSSACVFAYVGGYIYIGSPPSEGDRFTIQYKELNNYNYTNYQVGGLAAIPTIILYGILMYACTYLKDDNRIAVYKQKFDELILDWNRQERLHSRIQDESISMNGGPLA
jgi:hypothetical protein